MPENEGPKAKTGQETDTEKKAREAREYIRKLCEPPQFQTNPARRERKRQILLERQRLLDLERRMAAEKAAHQETPRAGVVANSWELEEGSIKVVSEFRDPGLVDEETMRLLESRHSHPAEARQESNLSNAVVFESLECNAETDAGAKNDPLPRRLPSCVGTLNYYRLRHEDFVRRHPNLEPPYYYLDYGEKYAARFMFQLRPQLSKQGQAWVGRTFERLQGALEDRLNRDRTKFDDLERDSEAFAKFAYETHAAAYLGAGLHSLPLADLLLIVQTPDAEDIFTKDGLAQIWKTVETLVPQKVNDLRMEIGRSCHLY